MREFGLILENVDGLEAPTTKFVMRGVPHTLGLQVSLQRDTGLANPPAPAEMTGWSGDGAPGAGSLREFATGAVTQHFTKSLLRRVGQDFKLPTSKQLDAMEGFSCRPAGRRISSCPRSRSTTRTSKPATNFSSTATARRTPAGPAISVIPTQAPTPARSENENRNFNTNVEDAPLPRARDLPNPFRRTAASGERPIRTAPSATVLSTRHPWWKRQTPARGSFTTTSRRRSMTSWTSTIGPVFNNLAVRPITAQFEFTDAGARPTRRLHARHKRAPEHRRGEARAQGNPRAQQRHRTRSEHTFTIGVRGYRRRDRRAQSGFLRALRALFPAAEDQLTNARNRISLAQQTGNATQRRQLIQEAINDTQGSQGHHRDCCSIAGATPPSAPDRATPTAILSSRRARPVRCEGCLPDSRRSPDTAGRQDPAVHRAPAA